MSTIVVLGGINIDLVGVTARLPMPGETVAGQRFFTAPGGKGANQAVAAARMGAHVCMVGRVGDDVFGPRLLHDLRSSGVDVSSVALDPEHSTGTAMILLDGQAQNHIVAIYGANMACDSEQLRAAVAALDGADCLMLQHEVPLEVSIAAAGAARAMGVRVIWDPAPPMPLPPEAYASIDVITPNQSEAGTLTSVEVADVDSAARAARELLGLGAPAVAVKLGEMGVYYATREFVGHVPAYEVEVVDTVAAGDAFGGALAVALAEGRDLAVAVRYGAAAGALAVTRPGALDAMPTRAQVEGLLSG